MVLDVEVTDPRVNDEKGHVEYQVIWDSLELQSGSTTRSVRYRWAVWRRFKEFEKLDEGLRKQYGAMMSRIRLPPTRIFGNKDPAFIRERQAGLQGYLKSVLGAIHGVADFDRDRLSSEVLRSFMEWDRRTELNTHYAGAAGAGAAGGSDSTSAFLKAEAASNAGAGSGGGSGGSSETGAAAAGSRASLSQASLRRLQARSAMVNSGLVTDPAVGGSGPSFAIVTQAIPSKPGQPAGTAMATQVVTVTAAPRPAPAPAPAPVAAAPAPAPAPPRPGPVMPPPMAPAPVAASGPPRPPAPPMAGPPAPPGAAAPPRPQGPPAPPGGGPPRPPGGPPRPPAPPGPGGAGAPAPPPADPGRGALLASIQAGKKLKKAVTVDKSKPRV